MTSAAAPAAPRRPLDGAAFGAMVLITALWGLQHVIIKAAAGEVPVVLQAALRSAIAGALLLAWARLRGIALWERDGTLGAGLLSGLLFAAEFVFLYSGLAFSNVSRLTVFVYLSPVLTALGLHFMDRRERMRLVQWAGVLLAFSGLALAFRDGFAAGQRATLAGDLCGLAAAVFWSATFLVVRGTRLARASATKVTFYQIGVSAPVLFACSVLIGEPGVAAWTPFALGALAYQGVVIAFATYVAWFWLFSRYLGAPLNVLTFMTPVFAIAGGMLFLGEAMSASLALAGGLVAAGIALVNLRR